VKPIVQRKVLNNLPDSKDFCGVMSITTIGYDLRPVLIIEAHKDNHGPELTIGIDYYAPAAAARMGLPVDRTTYIVKTDDAFDYCYQEATLKNFGKDQWGRYHAKEVAWRDIGNDRLKTILKDVGESHTNNIGKVGIFIGGDRIPKRRKINGYTGTEYLDDVGEIIVGELLRVESE
jgi:hypothetical protein